MPIRQLQDDKLGFVEAGRIRKGEMIPTKDGNKERPIERPYFVLNHAPNLIPYLGEEPTVIPVLLPYRTRDENFRVFMEEYRNGGCYCRGDGDKINRLVDPHGRGEYVIKDGVTRAEHQDELMDGSMVTRAVGEVAICPGPVRDRYPRCGNCRSNGMLFVMVRDPKTPTELVERRLVYYTVTTSSLNDIREITRSLNTVDELARSIKGDDYARTGMTYIPLLLKRKAGTVSAPTDNGRIQTEKWFISLEVDPILLDAIARAQSAQIKGTLGQDALPAPSMPSWEDGAVEGAYEELADVDAQMEERRANIEAMRDTMPATMRAGIDVIREFVGEGFDANEFGTLVRDKTGTEIGKPIFYNTDTWQYMLDVLIERYTAEPVETA